MRKRTSLICTLALCLALSLGSSLQAQTGATGKPPVYIYNAQWDVPRAQWGDIIKLDEQDRSILDKLVADGTLIGYGAYTNLIHQEGEPTHGTWFTATSEGNLLKALEVIYAHPASVSAPVQGASKHWDFVLTGDIYNSKPGSSGGYLTWSRWQLKPGSLHGYSDLTKNVFVPILDKLLADGSVTSYGLLTEDYHQGPLGTIYEYFTVPDAASLDKVNKAFEDAFHSNPAIGDALRSLTQPEGHQDFLTRLRYMVSK